MSVAHRLSHATHQGRRARNQDAVLAAALADGRVLLAVADGMGGHAAGEVASETALGALRAELEAGAALGDAVRRANLAVHALSESRPELEGMGTTLVALLRTGESYEIANVGDSRAYRVTSASVEQLTRDHSFVAEGMRDGTLSAEEAERSPWRHALTRSMGTEAEVDVDLFGPFAAGDESHAVLLCSDGLHQVLSPEVLLERLCPEANRAAAVAQLPEAAYQAGGTDNITVAMIEFGAVAAVAVQEPLAAETVPGAEPWAIEPVPRTPLVHTQRGGRQVTINAAPHAALAAWGSPRPRRRWVPISGERALFLLCTAALAVWMIWFVADLMEL